MAIISGTTLLANNLPETLNQSVTFAPANTRLTIFTKSLFTSLKLATKEVGSSGTDLTREIVQYWG